MIVLTTVRTMLADPIFSLTLIDDEELDVLDSVDLLMNDSKSEPHPNIIHADIDNLPVQQVNLYPLPYHGVKEIELSMQRNV